MIDFDIILNPDDKEGNPDPTARRMPESNYNLDNKDIVRKNSQVEEVLDSTRDALIHFIVSLPAAEQVFMVQQIYLSCLKKARCYQGLCCCKIHHEYRRTS